MKSDDPTVVSLAKMSLEWAEKDLKTGKIRFRYDDGSKKQSKEPGPVEVPHQTP